MTTASSTTSRANPFPGERPPAARYDQPLNERDQVIGYALLIPRQGDAACSAGPRRVVLDELGDQFEPRKGPAGISSGVIDL